MSEPIFSERTDPYFRPYFRSYFRPDIRPKQDIKPKAVDEPKPVEEPKPVDEPKEDIKPKPVDEPKKDIKPKPVDEPKQDIKRKKYIKPKQTYPKFKRLYRKPKPRIKSGEPIDYKDTKLLNNFISDLGKILSRRVTKLYSKQQRLINLAIKKARILSFLPFIYNFKNFERIKSTIIMDAQFRKKKKKFKSKRKNRSFFSKK